MMDWFLGTIQLLPYEPEGMMLCDGRSLYIPYYQPLFALIQFTYGGDHNLYFNIPNLIGAEPDPNLKYYIACMGLYPERQ